MVHNVFRLPLVFTSLSSPAVAWPSACSPVLISLISRSLHIPAQILLLLLSVQTSCIVSVLPCVFAFELLSPIPRPEPVHLSAYLYLPVSHFFVNHCTASALPPLYIPYYPACASRDCYCAVTLRNGFGVTEQEDEGGNGGGMMGKIDENRLWQVGMRRPANSGQLKCYRSAWLWMHIKQVWIHLAGAIMQRSSISEPWNLFGATDELNNCCLTAETWK